MGSVCGSCEDDYYQSIGSCKPCRQEGDTAELTIQILSILIFYLLLGLSVLALRDKNLDRLAYHVVTFQQLIIAAGTAAIWFEGEDWIRITFQVLKMVTFDYSFIRPGCTIAKYTFTNLFFLEIGFLAALVAYFVTCGTVHEFRKREAKSQKFCDWIRHRRAGAGAGDKRERIYKGAVVAFYCMYYEVVFRSMRILDCESISGFQGVYLVVERSQECFVSNHSIAAAFAVIALVFAVGIPAYLLWELRKLSLLGKLADDRSVKRFGFLVRSVRGEVYWFRPLHVFGLALLLATDATVGQTNVTHKLIVCLIIFSLNAVLGLWFWPMMTDLQNGWLICSANLRLLVVFLTFFADPDPNLGALVVGGLVIFVFFLGSFYFVYQKVKKQKILQRANKQGSIRFTTTIIIITVRTMHHATITTSAAVSL